MPRWLFAALILVVAISRAEADCVDPATLAHSAARIMRYFDDAEREARPGVLGARATGWFLSPTSIVTVEHVATSMRLTDQKWTPLEIGNGDNKQTIPARVQRVVGSRAEKIAVLELQTAFAGAGEFQLRMEPLHPEEHVVSLAYTDGRLRIAGGRFVHFGDHDRVAGMALLEIFDGDDRHVLDYGASGAPVLDCAGRLVAVVSNVLTTSIFFMSREIRVSTAWGDANVVSVPVSLLDGLSHLE